MLFRCLSGNHAVHRGLHCLLQLHGGTASQAPRSKTPFIAVNKPINGKSHLGYIKYTSIVVYTPQHCQIVTQITRITLDYVNSPADVNPKGTSTTAEGKKRASGSAAKDYGYCSFPSAICRHWTSPRIYPRTHV